MSEEPPAHRSQIAIVGDDFSRYWRAYGGWPALLGSPYFWASWLLTAALTPLWLQPTWWTDVISAAPSLLGFSLGGMALLLAFGNDRFKELLARSGGDSPRLLGLSASFVHFILVQSLSLLAAVLCKGWYFPPKKWLVALLDGFGVDPTNYVSATRLLWAPAFFLFVYSLLCAIAATFRIFSVTGTFVTVARADARRVEESERARLTKTPRPEAALPELRQAERAVI